MRQSAFVISLFLGTTTAAKLRKPASNTLFATGMEENAGLVSDIIVKENDTYTVKAQTEDKPAAAKPAAAKPAAAAEQKHGKAAGCNAGETLEADGSCKFEAESLKKRVNLAQFNANIAPEKVHTMIPEGYRTLANDGSYVMNLGEQRTTFMTQQEAKGDPAGNNYDNYWAWNYTHEAPEKVESFNWPHADRHTTFYADHKKANESLVQQESKFNANSEPEKVQTLIPEAYRTTAHTIVPNPEVRTAFYAEKTGAEQSLTQFDANIAPEKVHTLIPQGYKSLSDNGTYVMNLNEQRTAFYSQTGADIQYDNKNKLWRNMNLVQTQKEDTLGSENRDPWVQKFTEDAVKDIMHNSGKEDSLTQTGDVANNKYMAENIMDFTRNYTTPHNVFPRSEGAPKTSEVGHYWPMSYAQGKATGPMEKDALPLKIWADSFPRSDTPPT